MHTIINRRRGYYAEILVSSLCLVMLLGNRFESKLFAPGSSLIPESSQLLKSDGEASTVSSLLRHCDSIGLDATPNDLSKDLALVESANSVDSDDDDWSEPSHVSSLSCSFEPHSSESLRVSSSPQFVNSLDGLMSRRF